VLDGLADNVAQSLKKGSRVVVTAKLTQRTFEVEGTKPTMIEVQASPRGR
jgi:single-stranded DNA-binding protein